MSLVPLSVLLANIPLGAAALAGGRLNTTHTHTSFLRAGIVADRGLLSAVGDDEVDSIADDDADELVDAVDKAAAKEKVPILSDGWVMAETLQSCTDACRANSNSDWKLSCGTRDEREMRKLAKDRTRKWTTLKGVRQGKIMDFENKKKLSCRRVTNTGNKKCIPLVYSKTGKNGDCRFYHDHGVTNQIKCGNKDTATNLRRICHCTAKKIEKVSVGVSGSGGGASEAAEKAAELEYDEYKAEAEAFRKFQRNHPEGLHCEDKKSNCASRAKNKACTTKRKRIRRFMLRNCCASCRAVQGQKKERAL